MKKIYKAILFSAMFVIAFFSFSACKDEKEEDVFSIVEANMSQTEFAMGQELDLSNGELTVERNGEREKISLASEGVSVSGYDKDALGTQTLTITYKEQTVTLTVTVVARMTVKDAQTVYFVGDPFDRSKGELQIRKDDGTSFTVAMSDERVTVENFVTTAAADAQVVTVRFKDGTADYSTTIRVRIYALNNVTLTAPDKVEYKGYETKLDLSGGYLTVRGGTEKRQIDLTIEMVTGFDPSVVSPDNRGPVNQTLYVTYRDNVYEFNVNIVYSDLITVKENAVTLSDLNWEGTEIPDVSEEQGKLANDTLTMYLELSNDEKEAVTEKEKTDIFRAAAVYSYERWKTEIAAYDRTFKANGMVVNIDCKDVSETKEDLAKLEDTSSVLYVYDRVLNALLAEYSDYILIGKKTIGEYLEGVYASSIYETVVGVLQFMIELHETLTVPTSWTQETLVDHADEIKAATKLLTENQYGSRAYDFVLATVSQWREKDDYFDILYGYYYSVDDWEGIDSLKNIRLPGVVEELYATLADGMYEIAAMRKQSVVDSSRFMSCFYRSVELRDEVSESKNEMYKKLYETLEFPFISLEGDTFDMSFDDMFEYNRTVEYGYLYLVNGLLGVDAFEAFWQEYYAILSDLTEDAKYAESEEYGQAIELLFENFVELSPSEQYGILDALNVFYRYGYPKVSFDDSNGSYNDFAYVVLKHYRETLPESGKTIFENLVLALEAFTRRYYDGGSLSDFEYRMYLVELDYKVLKDEDKAAFDKKVGFLYEKYMDLYKTYVDTDSVVQTSLGEWKGKFDKLSVAIQNAMIAAETVADGEKAYFVFLSAYETAASLAEEILTTAPENILRAYYYETYEDVSWSLEFGLYDIRRTYSKYMTETFSLTDGERVYELWDLYVAYDMKPFVKDMYELLIAYEIGSKYTDAEAVMKLMESFRSLPIVAQDMYFDIDTDFMYHKALKAFFADMFAEGSKAAEAAEKVIDLEAAYIAYAIDKENETKLETLKDLLAEAETLYKALEGEAKEGFNTYLLATYQYYLTACEGL